MLDTRERLLALDDSGRAGASLRVDELVEAASLLNPVGHVWWDGGRHLSVLGERDGELRLLDRGDDPLRLRDELHLAEPAGRLGGMDEPFGVLGAEIAIDALLDRLRAELGDRVTRVDALRTAFVAEIAARAVPDPVLVVVGLEPLDLRALTRVADEAEALRQRRGPEELGVGLHRVALGDAAAAHDAQRLLVDRVHLLLRVAELPLRDLLVAGVEPRLHAADLRPERRHIDDEVLEDGHVPHRRDDRDVAPLDDRLHPLLAREDRASVHAHAARAADHHATALAEAERAVDLVLDDIEDVEEARPFRSLHVVVLERALAGLRVEAPDLEGDVHQ